jgi:eukaryotic-like serine/threonine-protein kinase
VQPQPEHKGGPTARPEPTLPAVFGRYLLLQRLSRGGMGEIFMAKHGLAGFEKLAVIKKVLPHLSEDSQFISRFVDEAQVAIKLAHVNIAQVFEVGRVGDEYFLALEYVDGRDLRRTLTLLAQEKRRIPVDLALLIGRELANGLAYAHRRTAADGSSLGLVHCDISPPNVMVSFEGETKIIDFGIARSALRGTATDPKMGFGKFGYMAPEQLIRGGVVDHRTDVYAAGVVLFELLTGQRLYEPKDFTDYRALARAVAQGQHRVPSDVDRALAQCDPLITTALAPRPEERYSTAADLRDSIQRILAVVNPTVSTDQLSSLMRGLFAKEVAQQRELQERIASTHLADFQEQLNTQAVPTVSFALSESSVEAAPKRTQDLTAAERPARKASPPGTAMPRPAAAPRQSGQASGQARPASQATPSAGNLRPNQVPPAQASARQATGPNPQARQATGPNPQARQATGPNPRPGANPAAAATSTGRVPGGPPGQPNQAPGSSGPVGQGARSPGAGASGPVAALAAGARVAPQPSLTSPPSQAISSASTAHRREASQDSASRLQAQALRSQRSTMIVVAVSAAVAVAAIVFVLMRNFFHDAPATRLVPSVQPIEEEPPPPKLPPVIEPGAAPSAPSVPAVPLKPPPTTRMSP